MKPITSDSRESRLLPLGLGVLVAIGTAAAITLTRHRAVAPRVVAAGAPASDLAPRIAAHPEGPGAVPSSVRLRGVVLSGDHSIASVSLAGVPGATWVSEGEKVGPFFIRSIRPGSIVVSLGEDGAEATVYVGDGAVLEPGEASAMADSAPGGEPEPYSRAWINSPANPMLVHLQPLPIDVRRHWLDLTGAEREEIVDFYLKHGWRLISAESAGGAMTFAWENIFEDERREKLRQNREAFAAVLDASQAHQWSQIRSNQPIFAVNGSLTPEQEAEAVARRKAVAEFEASLSPAQSTAYRATTDFTQADWR